MPSHDRVIEVLGLREQSNSSVVDISSISDEFKRSFIANGESDEWESDKFQNDLGVALKPLLKIMGDSGCNPGLRL